MGNADGKEGKKPDEKEAQPGVSPRLTVEALANLQKDLAANNIAAQPAAWRTSRDQQQQQQAQPGVSTRLTADALADHQLCHTANHPTKALAGLQASLAEPADTQEAQLGESPQLTKKAVADLRRLRKSQRGHVADRAAGTDVADMADVAEADVAEVADAPREEAYSFAAKTQPPELLASLHARDLQQGVSRDGAYLRLESCNEEVATQWESPQAASDMLGHLQQGVSRDGAYLRLESCNEEVVEFLRERNLQRDIPADGLRCESTGRQRPELCKEEAAATPSVEPFSFLPGKVPAAAFQPCMRITADPSSDDWVSNSCEEEAASAEPWHPDAGLDDAPDELKPWPPPGNEAEDDRLQLTLKLQFLGPPAASKLEQVLREDLSLKVRQVAAATLGDLIQDHSSAHICRRAFSAALESDSASDASIRRIAAASLGNAVGGDVAEVAAALLLARLMDSDAEVRRISGESLRLLDELTPMRANGKAGGKACGEPRGDAEEEARLRSRRRSAMARNLACAEDEGEAGGVANDSSPRCAFQGGDFGGKPNAWSPRGAPGPVVLVSSTHVAPAFGVKVGVEDEMID